MTSSTSDGLHNMPSFKGKGLHDMRLFKGLGLQFTQDVTSFRDNGLYDIKIYTSIFVYFKGFKLRRDVQWETILYKASVEK